MPPLKEIHNPLIRKDFFFGTLADGARGASHGVTILSYPYM
jgi:hypothetical protein